MRMLLPIAALSLAISLAAAPPALAAASTPQILLGVPQPIAGTAFTINVLVEASANAAPLATGNVTIHWGDETPTTQSALSNSLVSAQHTFAAAGVFTITASYAGDSNDSAASATQTVLALASAPGPIALSTFGDSITSGVGASTPADDFASLTAATEAWELRNFGVPGDTSVDTNEYINAKSPEPSFAYNTLLIGNNDLRFAMTSSAGEAEFTAAVSADAVWLSTIQGTNRITAASSANKTTGAWTASTLYPFTALTSTVAGSTIQGSFTGNVFYAQISRTTTATSSVSITIDGAAPVTYTPPVLDYAGTRINYGPYFIRLPLTGANSQSHSVLFTCVAPNSAGCDVDWFAGNGRTNLAQPPYLWLATPYFTGQPGYPQSEYTQMAQLVRNIQTQLAADGLPVFLADVANWFNGVTDSACMYDEVHPSDCGHAMLAATFVNSINRLLLTSDRSLTAVALAAATDPVSIGQNATLTATLSAGYGTPTGTVSFYYDTQLLQIAPIVSGAASFTGSTVGFAPGLFPITAAYSGDSNFGPATSEPLNLALTSAATATTLTASPATVTPPASVVLSATAVRTSGSGIPTGKITFSSGSLALGSATLNSAGTASFTAASSAIPAGTYSITAKYSGDTADIPSTSLPLKITVK
jgi:hypothetical protein